MLMETVSAGSGSIEVMFLRQMGDDPFVSTPERRAQIGEVASRIARFISEARSTLDIAIYDFRLHDEAAAIIADALRERAKNKVVIRIIYAPRGGQEGARHGDFRALIRRHCADKRYHRLSGVDA